MTSLFVDNLTVIDFSYLDPQRGLVGESWIVNLILDGDLNQEGMLFDFGHVKKQIKQAIDELADHKLIIPEQYTDFSINTGMGRHQLQWQSQAGGKLELHCPLSAVLLLPCAELKREALIDFLEAALLPLLPDNISKVTLDLQAEDIPSPFYHYSHGLKKHDGDCQRIAHGHRSKIIIYKDGQRDESLELIWANKFKDIYIGSREDLSEAKENNSENYYFSYTANQGDFSLSIAKSACHIIDTDSTVEFIAEHLATELKKAMPEHSFRAQAYEGVGKGAISES